MNKNKIIFLISIVSVSFVVGIFFANILSENDKNLIYSKVTTYFLNLKNNVQIDYKSNFLNIFYHNYLFLIIIWILGLSIIGLGINTPILFYKGFILGFTMGSIINIYLYKGIILSIAYVFPHMIINLLIFLFLTYYANNFSYKLFQLLFLKKDIKFNNMFKKYIKILGISALVVLFSTIIETFISPHLIKTFTFLIK